MSIPLTLALIYLAVLILPRLLVFLFIAAIVVGIATSGK